MTAGARSEARVGRDDGLPGDVRGPAMCVDPACTCLPFAAGVGRHRVWGTALFSTDGLSVNLLGGDSPHIGAVAVAIPRPRLVRQHRRSVTTSVFTLVGHQDDALAHPMATELARRLGVTVVVTAGVHISRARASDIAAVLRNARNAARNILASAARSRRAGRRHR